MRIFLIAVLALTAFTSISHSQDSEQGWGLFFKEDTFDKTVYPVAMMAESGEDFGSINVGVACGPNGKLIPFFHNPLALSFELMPINIEFRSGAKSEKLKFEVGKIPHLGNQFRLNGNGTKEFLELFSNASGPVAYKIDSNQGQFSTIAAKRVFRIVRNSCGMASGGN